MPSPAAAAAPAPAQLADRVMSRCEELALCSEESGRVTRRYLTPAMMEAHHRLAGWMREAGLSVRVDEAGNLIGRLAAADPKAKTLLVGSHLDSVPGAGRYDGVLGVVMGLGVAEALAPAAGGAPLPFHLDVIGFSEEEGVRYRKPYLGSSAVAGQFRADWLDRQDDAGVTMREAIKNFGLEPDRLADCAYSADGVIGYLEPHLEQGPVLERAGSPVGVVTGIAGQSRLRLRFTGRAGHAGTEPMAGRRDALVAASVFIAEARRVGLGDEHLRATVGELRVSPNAPNVIPGAAELSLDVRHPEDAVRERAVIGLRMAGEEIAAAEGCRFDVLEHTEQPATVIDRSMASLLTQTIADCGHAPLPLPSGAGHDAVVMARRFPTAMLFVRHPGGVSHHPDERADPADVAAAIDVLRRFVLRLAGERGEA